MIQVYELDGKQLHTPAEAHPYLAQTLSFPLYYGNNADALHDCLRELTTETMLFVTSADKVDASILRVLTDSQAENPMLTVFLEGEEE